MLPHDMSNKFRWKSQRQKKHLRNILGTCLERFACVREDEFHFTSSEFVEGIPPFACEFAAQTSIQHLLAAADEDGQVVIYDTNFTGQAAKVKDWSAHNNAIFDIAWSSTDPRLVTASGDQSAALWDIRTATCLASFKHHRCSLKSISFRPWDGHVFATGARDGSIMIWDDRCKKRGTGSGQLPIASISDAHMDQKKTKTQPKRRKKLASNLPTIDSSQSVSVVLFQKEDTLLSAGSADGIVKVWDLRKLKGSGAAVPCPSHQFPYSGTSNRKRGFSSLALSSARTRLYASCTDSVVYEYDLGGVLGSKPMARYRDHMNSTFFVKAAVSPDDLFLLSGSSDNHAYIWKIGEPESAPVILEGHDAEVTDVAWSPRDFTKVVTCSDDNTMRIWKMSAADDDHDEGNTVIGKARRCQRRTTAESQGYAEGGFEDRTVSQPASPASDSNRSTPTSEISASPLSPQLSPMPSSAKKRKFSLRDWATTTSPKPSRPSSPVSASPVSASPVSSSKRRKSETSTSVCDSDESAVGNESAKKFGLKIWASPKTARLSSPALSTKRRKSESSPGIQDVDEENEENRARMKSAKKSKFSLKEWASTSPKPSSGSSQPVSSLVRKKSDSSTGIQDSDESAVERPESVTVLSKSDLKRKMTVNSSKSDVICSPVIEKKRKISDSDMKHMSSASSKSLKDDKSELKNTNKTAEPSSDAAKRDQKTKSERDTSIICNGLDKENLSRKEEKEEKVSRKNVSNNSIPKQRSPLRADNPTNWAKCISSSQSAKKNIASHFQSSGNSGDGKCEKGEEGGGGGGGGRGGKDTKQPQNLKECFKEKKVGGLAKTKRKNSISTIDGYFQPIEKISESDA